MKNKNLVEKFQPIMAVISFISSIFLIIFLLGKDVQGSTTKIETSASDIVKINSNIDEMKKEDINLSTKLLHLSIDFITSKKEVDLISIESKEIKKQQSEMEKQLIEINKNIDFTNYLQNKFINEDFKQFKDEIREYMKRDK